MDGLPARIEHSALRRELSTGHFQAFLGFFIRGYSLVGVPAARAPALRIGSFGEGVVVVLAQGRTAFLFGEICQIFVCITFVPLPVFNSVRVRQLLF